MPFYLVCDVSAAMYHEMATLHDGAMRLRKAILGHPVLDDVARVCVMTFSDDAKVVVKLTRMSELPEGMPVFSSEDLPKSRYGVAFRRLAKEMAEDYAALRRNGQLVYRPCVYFLTGGEPTDPDWRDTLTETLTAGPMARMGHHPIIVPFGFREASDRILRRLAYPPRVSKWYHASNTSVEDALEGLLDIIRKSVLASGRSALTGDPEHVLPEPETDSGISYGIADRNPET